MKITINSLFLFMLIALLFGCGAKHVELEDWGTQLPDWVKQLPEDEDYFYARGGPSQTLPKAEDDARSAMLKSIKVWVEAETTIFIKERNDEVERRLTYIVRTLATGFLEHVSIFNTHRGPEGFYALAQMPRHPPSDVVREPPDISEKDEAISFQILGEQFGFPLLEIRVINGNGVLTLSLPKIGWQEDKQLDASGTCTVSILALMTRFTTFRLIENGFDVKVSTRIGGRHVHKTFSLSPQTLSTYSELAQRAFQ